MHIENLEDLESLKKAFEGERVNTVVNLAAQAGVRYSIENPQSYIQSNLVGFGNILECCRHNDIEHLIYASSSSVYGGNSCLPYSEHQGVDHPVSLYAASKKANELMAALGRCPAGHALRHPGVIHGRSTNVGTDVISLVW